MTENDLEELAKLADEASAPPWHVCFTNDAFMSAVLVLRNPTIGRVYEMYDNKWPSEDVVAICLLQEPSVAGVGDGRWDDNARLIAATRNHLTELMRLARIGLAHEQRDPGSGPE